MACLMADDFDHGLSLDYTDFDAVSFTSLKTVVRFYLCLLIIILWMLFVWRLITKALLDDFCSLYVAGHVHVCLSYLDGFEIDLNLETNLDNVMVTDNFEGKLLIICLKRFSLIAHYLFVNIGAPVNN